MTRLVALAVVASQARGTVGPDYARPRRAIGDQAPMALARSTRRYA